MATIVVPIVAMIRDEPQIQCRRPEGRRHSYFFPVQVIPSAIRRLLNTSPARSRRCDELATSASRTDALAGPGVITHDEHEDPDSENGVDEPAKSRCRYVEHDSDRRPQYL